MYFQTEITCKTYISDFSYSKHQWNGAVLCNLFIERPSNIHLVTISQCDRRTDGQMCHKKSFSACTNMLTRDKNDRYKAIKLLHLFMTAEDVIFFIYSLIKVARDRRPFLSCLCFLFFPEKFQVVLLSLFIYYACFLLEQI